MKYKVYFLYLLSLVFSTSEMNNIDKKVTSVSNWNDFLSLRKLETYHSRHIQKHITRNFIKNKVYNIEFTKKTKNKNLKLNIW